MAAIIRLPFFFLVLAAYILAPKFCVAQSGVDITLEGGETTVDDSSTKAFNHVLANISDSATEDQHDLGETGFLRNFARTPVGGKIRLGPEFNNVSCIGCHANNGRGIIGFKRNGSDTIVKVSVPTGKSQVPGGPAAVPGFGTQLHDHATSGMKPDAKLKVLWEFIDALYPDGTPYQLRKPKLSVKAANKKTLPRNTMFSIRRAPPVFGAGLLDSIDEETINGFAARQAADNEGITGKANLVWDIASKKVKLGRFGFKAASPTLIQQIASAYAGDMGVTNALVRLSDRKPDIPQRILSATTFYNQTLAVPRARAQDSLTVIHGKELFQSIGCSSCHIMTVVTGNSSVPELSSQTIHPFTDLLLHDMGDGLTDNRPEFLATGTEWRTTPLWGIGLTSEIIAGGQENYLHDGRARSLEEAILWHGGEATQANQKFQNLSASDRADLIAFLRSL